MEEIKVQLISNISKLEDLIKKAEQQKAELAETLQQIEDFKLEVGTDRLT